VWEDSSATDGLRHHRRSRSLRARMVGAALTITLLISALGGCLEHSERELPPYTPDPRATNCDEIASANECVPYSLRFAGPVLPGVDGAVDPLHKMLPRSGSLPARIVGTWWVKGDERQEARTSIVRFPGPADSTTIDGSLLLKPFIDPASAEQRLLTWCPSLRYVSIGSAPRLSPEELFVRNYSKETLLSDSECLLMALRAASRGESLVVSNRLLVLSDSGDIKKEFLLGARQKPTHAHIVRLRGRETALVDFNSGYQVSEMLYRELMHPRLAPGKIMSPSATDAVFGSFRGIVAIDIETGQVLWKRRLGAPPGSGVVWDLNGDGLDEIIYRTTSTGNGVNGSGVTDAGCAHVLCLDHEGHELWRHRFTGPYLRLQVGISDLADAPGYEIVVVSGSEQSSATGTVTILSSSGDLLTETSVLGSPRGLVLVDLTGDGREDIVVGGTRGRMHVLDAALDIVSTFVDTAHQRYQERSVAPVAANDIDGDGEMEILATSLGWAIEEWNVRMYRGRLITSPDRYVIATDADLVEEARARFVEPSAGVTGLARGPGGVWGFIGDLNANGCNEFVLPRNALGAYVFEVVPEGVTE